MTAVHCAVLHVLGDIRRAYQQDVDRRAAAADGERAHVTRLELETGRVQQSQRTLMQPPLDRDGDRDVDRLHGRAATPSGGREERPRTHGGVPEPAKAVDDVGLAP